MGTGMNGFGSAALSKLAKQTIKNHFSTFAETMKTVEEVPFDKKAFENMRDKELAEKKAKEQKQNDENMK